MIQAHTQTSCATAVGNYHFIHLSYKEFTPDAAAPLYDVME